MSGFKDLYEGILDFWNNHHKILIALVTLFMSLIPSILKTIFFKCDPCYMIGTINAKDIGEKELEHLFDTEELKKHKITSKNINNYSIAQLILWNKGRLPLTIDDYKVFRKDAEPIEKVPFFTVDGNVTIIDSFVDDSFFFEITESKKSDSEVVFRFKDEISHKEGFLINVLYKTNKKEQVKQPELTMTLNHKRVRKINMIDKIWFILYILATLGCFTMFALFASLNNLAGTLIYFIALIVSIYNLKSTIELSFFPVPKKLKKNALLVLK